MLSNKINALESLKMFAYWSLVSGVQILLSHY